MFRVIAGSMFLLMWISAAVIAAELYQRIHFAGISTKNPHTMQFVELQNANQTIEANLWEEPFWKYKPNSVAKMDSKLDKWEVRINSLGYRSRETTLEKPAGVYRIVCVGGSTTMEGWFNSTTYPAYLEEMLRVQYQTESIEVINCGISGLKSQGELAKVNEYLAFEPDMLMEYNFVNDLCFNLYPRWKQSLIESSLIRRILGKSLFLTQRWEQFFLPNRSVMEDDIRDYVVDNLQSLGRTAKEKGVVPVFMTFSAPDIQKLTRDELEFYDHNLKTIWQAPDLSFDTYCELVECYNRELLRMCQQENIICLPVADQFTGNIRTFTDICHLTDQGIKAKAETISRLLKAEFPDTLPE